MTSTMTFMFLAITIGQSLATVPYAWESDISRGNWWCSPLEANNFYPIQERHLDVNNVIHLSAHGFTAMQLCNMYFAASEPIVVDWLERWYSDDPRATMSLYARYHSWDAWRLLWTVSMTGQRTSPSIDLENVPNKLIRLEFRNPDRRRIDFSIVIRPASYKGPHQALDASDIEEPSADDTSYYGMDPPEEWELALIIVGSLFGLCVIGIAIYFMIIYLCKDQSILQ